MRDLLEVYDSRTEQTGKRYHPETRDTSLDCVPDSLPVSSEIRRKRDVGKVQRHRVGRSLDGLLEGFGASSKGNERESLGTYGVTYEGRELGDSGVVVEQRIVREGDLRWRTGRQPSSFGT